MRLDAYLQKQYPDISRAQLQRLIKQGKVLVGDQRPSKTGFEVSERDTISVELDLTGPQEVPKIDLPVIYEDSDCVVVNKPVGVLTHSKGTFNPEATVASWLAMRKDFKLLNDEENFRSGIVHRLDRATSGVIICAKNQAALTHLQKQFHDRKAKKTYIARVAGGVRPPEALIDLPIERNPKQPQRFRVGQNGRPAQTVYKTLDTVQQGKSFDTVLELKPVTGRTHQLRVHLDYLKHPIIGDAFYDGRPAKRLYLHAYMLEITLPNKERQQFEAEVPPDFYQENIK